MATNTKTSKASVQSQNALIIQGIQKHLESTASMIFNGVSYTPTTLIALFQSQTDALNASSAAHAQWITAAAAAAAMVKPMNSARAGLTEMVRQMFNNAPNTLGDFGFTPRKSTATKSPVTKVVAAAKNRATREARHTMGKVQKLSVVGSLTGPIVVQPGTGSASPSVSSSSIPEPAPTAIPAAAATAHPAESAPSNGAPSAASKPLHGD